MSAVTSRLVEPTDAPRVYARESFTSTSELTMVFLLGGLDVGGAERQAIALATALHRRGERVHLVAMQDGPLRAVAEQAGVPVHVVGRPFDFSPAALPQLIACLHSIAPDVIYAFLEVQWLLALAASSTMRNTRTVLGLRTSQYGSSTLGLRDRALFRLVRRAVAHADLLIANSPEGLTDFAAHCPTMPAGFIVPNGIDVTTLAPLPAAAGALRRAWNIPADALIVGHVGRLDRVKDHEMLIDAFGDLARSDPRLWLVCVGDGTRERRNQLMAHARRAAVAARVLFTGPRSDLAAVYSAFDVLALSSLREGFPNVVAEAMACGVPAVVTRTGASAQIVGALGEVVAAGDRAAFASALVRILERRSPALSAACRIRMLDSYTLDRCAEHTMDAFRTLFP